MSCILQFVSSNSAKQVDVILLIKMNINQSYDDDQQPKQSIVTQPDSTQQHSINNIQF